MPSVQHILIVLLVAFFLFGIGKFPRMMEDLAKGIKAFKKGMKDEQGPENKNEPEKKDEA